MALTNTVALQRRAVSEQAARRGSLNASTAAARSAGEPMRPCLSLASGRSMSPRLSSHRFSWSICHFTESPIFAVSYSYGGWMMQALSGCSGGLAVSAAKAVATTAAHNARTAFRAFMSDRATAVSGTECALRGGSVCRGSRRSRCQPSCEAARCGVSQCGRARAGAKQGCCRPSPRPRKSAR